MGFTRLFAVAAVCAGACSDPAAVKPDSPLGPNGCANEMDCAMPTPYCEPVSSTCVQCRFSSHCASTNGVCEGMQCRAPRSCVELKAELPALQSGVYRIDLDGAGPLAALDVFCEMTIDGGGWMLVQRTRWQWSESMPLKTGWTAWHDSTVGSAAVGKAFRLAGKHWPAVAAMGDLLVSHRVRTTSGSACNPLWYRGSGGTFTIDETARTATIANLTQSVPLIAMTGLSTEDSGPDPMCIATQNGVPWFYNSCCSTCPTYQGSYWNDEPHPMAAYTDMADSFSRTETDVCAGQTVRMTDNASPFRGIDTMEMYLR